MPTQFPFTFPATFGPPATRQPYEPPRIQSRGWRVGPIEHRMELAAGSGAGLPATVSVSVTAAMDLAVATGDAPIPTLLYTPVYTFDVLPAVSSGDGLAGTASVNVTAAIDLGVGTGDALVPTMSVQLPLSLVGGTAAFAASITLPTHQAGDDIYIWAVNTSSTTGCTKPTASGTVPAWVDIDNPSGANNTQMRCAHFVATANTTTSGTWGNATHMMAAVVRGQNATTPVGGHAEGTGTSLDPTAPSITMGNTSGSSILFYAFAHRRAGSYPTVSGYTLLATAGTGNPKVGLYQKNTTTSDGTFTPTGTGSLTEGWYASTLEVLQ